jgi:VanZ family protein
MTTKFNPVGEQSGIFYFGYYWLPPLFLTAGILVMAGDLGSASSLKLPIVILKHLLPSWSPQEIFKLYLELRKIGHFLAYAALFFTYVRAWRWHLQMPRLKAIFLALAICLLVSSADEGRQWFHPDRTGSPRDIGLDMSGALTAAIATFPFLRQKDTTK